MKKNIKTHLQAVLYYIGLAKSRLYYATGYYFEDVQSKDDLAEVIRLLANWYYIPNYLQDITTIKD